MRHRKYGIRKWLAKFFERTSNCPCEKCRSYRDAETSWKMRAIYSVLYVLLFVGVFLLCIVVDGLLKLVAHIIVWWGQSL